MEVPRPQVDDEEDEDTYVPPSTNTEEVKNIEEDVQAKEVAADEEPVEDEPVVTSNQPAEDQEPEHVQ
jgi:hypothetical protein